MSLEWNAYKARHGTEGTDMSISAIVLFSSPIVVSILFVLLERVLIYIFVDKLKIKKSELRSNDFDQLSKSMQKRIERRRGDGIISRTFVSVAAHTDEYNVTRVGPVLSLPFID